VADTTYWLRRIVECRNAHVAALLEGFDVPVSAFSDPFTFPIPSNLIPYSHHFLISLVLSNHIMPTHCTCAGFEYQSGGGGYGGGFQGGGGYDTTGGGYGGMNPMDDVDMNAGGFDAMADSSGAKGSAEKKKYKEKSILPVTIKQINKGTRHECLPVHALELSPWRHAILFSICLRIY